MVLALRREGRGGVGWARAALALAVAAARCRHLWRRVLVLGRWNAGGGEGAIVFVARAVVGGRGFGV